MTSAVDEMKLAAELVQRENFMGRCSGGMPLLSGVEECVFCGATYAEPCRRAPPSPEREA